MYVLPRFQFPSFCDTIQRHRITYAYVVPPVILELVSNAATKNYDLSSLRMVVSAAAPLAVDLIHAAKQKLGLVVRQAYGMSECAPAIHFQVRIPPYYPIDPQKQRITDEMNDRPGLKPTPTPAPLGDSSPT